MNKNMVVSSRVRLARNIKEYPFPVKMNKDQATKIIDEVKNIILQSSDKAKENFVFVDMENVSFNEKQLLVEKHLISPNFALNTNKSAVIISKDETISIMINEEDHLRIQSIFPSLQFEKASDICFKINSMLEEQLEFAYDKQFGYLTCCPTNVGTGLRASVMIHLPALTMTGYITKVLEACGKLGVAVRGMYGENSEAFGNMFQVSNQLTIGMSEEEIIQNTTNVVSQIAEQENTLRNELFYQNRNRFEDKIFRSLGVLRSARIISVDESLRLLSDLRLAVEMDLIKEVKISDLNLLSLAVQPSNLQKQIGRNLLPEEREVARAEFIRNKLKETTEKYI